jgi:site-specific DNA-methyltransferase (adenine-specific)
MINKIHLGDCLEVMSLIPDASIDMVLCDLPYGMTANKWDSVIDLNDLWKQYERILKPNGVVILTSMGAFTGAVISSNLKKFKYKMIWIKKKAVNFLNAKKAPLRKHEDICVFYKKNPTYNSVFSEGTPYVANNSSRSSNYGHMKGGIGVNTGYRYPTDILEFAHPSNKEKIHGKHPTQKPLALAQYLIKTYTNEGDTVLDNACGGGSFLVAAKMEGRNFIGIEKDSHYHEIACKRLEDVKTDALSQPLQRVETFS